MILSFFFFFKYCLCGVLTCMLLIDSAITKENSSTTYPMPWISSKVTNPSSNTDKLPKETGEADSLNEPSIQEQSGLSNSEKIHMESDSSVPQLNVSSMPFLAKSDSDSEKPLRSCDLSVDTRCLFFSIIKCSLISFSFLLFYFVYDYFHFFKITQQIKTTTYTTGGPTN